MRHLGKNQQRAKAIKALWVRWLWWVVMFVGVLVVDGQHPGGLPETDVVLGLLGVGVLIFGGLLLLAHHDPNR